MVSKIFGLFVLLAVVTTGNCLTEIILEDEYSTFLTNPLIGKTISIPKFTFDTLQTCHIVLPTGAMVEAFPKNDLEDPYLSFLTAVEPFNACGFGFLNAPVDYSGTYELYSVVNDFAGAGLSLTRKKFHITFYESDSWQVPQQAEKA